MKIENIEINKIRQAVNVRQRIEEDDVSQLMSSIKKEGLLQPIGVKPDNGYYTIIYGNRRFEAYKNILAQNKINYDKNIVRLQIFLLKMPMSSLWIF